MVSGVRAALNATLRWANRSTLPEAAPIERVAIVCLVAAGLFFRSRGMLFGERLELWNDEASWAMRMFERPLGEHMIRPPGYVLFARFSATLLGHTEFAFRLLPWLAGMVTPFVAVLLARRFLSNAAARVLFVGVICLSLNAIEFSKEFKQYAIGLLLQLLLPLLALRWVDTRRRRDLVVACALAPLGLMFSQDVMFLYPGLFLVLLLEAWRSRNRRDLLLVAAAGAATLALVVGMYLLVWSRIKKDVAEEHWGNRYDVFYLESGGKKVEQTSRAAWTADKYADMAAMPGARRDFWLPGAVSREKMAELGRVDYGVWVLLHVAGLATLLWARRWREALLFWSPVLVCTVLNLAGRWPLGAFRTNLFLLAGTTAVAVAAFEWFRPVQAKLLSLLPVFVLVLLPLVTFERHWHSQKPGVYAAGVLAMLEELSRKRGPKGDGKERLYMDTHACQPFRYYTKYHPEGVRLWRDLEPKIEPICGRKRPRLVAAAAKRPSRQRVWLLFAGKAKVPKQLKVLSRASKLRHSLIEARVR